MDPVLPRDEFAVLVEDFGEDGCWLVAELEALSAEEPDPQRAWRDIASFLARGPRLGTDLRTLRADPVALDLLVRLSTTSRFGWELAQHLPRMFWDAVQEREYRQIWGRSLMAEGLRRQLDRRGDYTHRVNALVRFRNYTLLRVILGAIAGTLPFEAITAELSDMTDVLTEAALELALGKSTARYGKPSCGLVVLGMGKLGGRELNYSSDIDLIFVYGENGETSGGRKTIDHHSFFRRVGTELIRILDEHHPSGRLFRVDMRLRPQGAAGELVLSFAETVNYYYSVGRAWERQAMIKARPIAGDLALGQRLLGELRSWVYPADHRIEELDAARLMRRRIEERVGDANVKAGIGGIRDIEFLVQYYQLQFGGREPQLRVRATLPALRALQDQGLIEREDAAALEEDYIWLRMVEHRLQMFEARQLHDLPDDPIERCHLAHRCGFTGPNGCDEFDAHHSAVRLRVRRLSEQHYLGGDDREDTYVALIGSENLDPVIATEVLGPLGFEEPVAAAERLRAMAAEPFFILQQGRTERALIKLLPMLLARLATAPAPDEALANFQRITASVGGRSAFFTQLRERAELLDIYANLAGWASFVVNELTRFTGLPDEVAEQVQHGFDERPPLLEDARALSRGLADPVPALGYLKARELATVAVADLGGLPLQRITRRLTRLSAAVIQIVLEAAHAERVERWGRPMIDGRPSRFAILGLGKLGGHELSYASDMDVIFVCDPGGTCPQSGRDAEEFWTRVARNTIARCQDGGLYEVDPRLRPWGEQGQLVVNTRTLEQYWSQPRDLWERLAMTRVGMLAGDLRLGTQAATIIRRAALTAALPADAAEQVRSMRSRLEESVSGRDHLKRGWGGYNDIEFLAFYQSLGCRPEDLPASAPVDRTLQVLGELGRIPPAAVVDCRAALAFLRGIEARMRLMEGRAISSLPVDAAARRRFARCAGFSGTETMDLSLHLARERARRWFDGLLH
jgi:glutamate-ammonia-ligase adenylyltransferase